MPHLSLNKTGKITVRIRNTRGDTARCAGDVESLWFMRTPWRAGLLRIQLNNDR
jgi:hypothetical protein